jgi:hypothetical protein
MIYTFFYWISIGSIGLGIGFIAGYFIMEQLIYRGIYHIV